MFLAFKISRGGTPTAPIACRQDRVTCRHRRASFVNRGRQTRRPTSRGSVGRKRTCGNVGSIGHPCTPGYAYLSQPPFGSCVPKRPHWTVHSATLVPAVMTSTSASSTKLRVEWRIAASEGSPWADHRPAPYRSGLGGLRAVRRKMNARLLLGRFVPFRLAAVSRVRRGRLLRVDDRARALGRAARVGRQG